MNDEASHVSDRNTAIRENEPRDAETRGELGVDAAVRSG